jgi:hypothetical protein
MVRTFGIYQREKKEEEQHPRAERKSNNKLSGDKWM